MAKILKYIVHQNNPNLLKGSNKNTPQNQPISIERVVNRPYHGHIKDLRGPLGTSSTALELFLMHNAERSEQAE